MTRTDVMASSRPRTAGAAPSSRRSTSVARRLSALPVVLLLALALVLPAAAAAGEKSGYTQKTPTTSTKTTPKTGTLPAKESEEPAKAPVAEAEPEKTTSASPTTEKATTLPFTGFDLSWDIGFGVVLIAAGFSILAMQRRQRRHPQS
ncbi:MAG TPA: hypothetical protein VIH92_13055 [Solirubrobacteraceae bacterium]|jgi:hypothetical protein